MKKLQFFLLAAVAIVFAACSNDDVVLTDTGSTGTYEGGDGYIALNISMPAQTSTRAISATNSDNGVFEDGDADEYKVHDATLLLFSGADESTAKLYGIYPISSWDTATNSNTQITQTHTVVQEIDLPDQSTDYMYALVVLNKGDILTYSGSGKDFTGATLGNVTLSKGTTDLATLQTTSYTPSSVSAMASNAHGFFMTNAPLFNAQGGTQAPTSGKVMTLATVNKDKVHGTYDDANAAATDPAAIVYVERAVAKVTVEQENSLDLSELTAINSTFTSATVNGFILDVTNNDTYIVRNATNSDAHKLWWSYASNAYTVVTDNTQDPPVDSNVATVTTNSYRFVEATSVGSDAGVTDAAGTSTLYRTYWGEDPNYDGSEAVTNLSITDSLTLASTDLKPLVDTTNSKENPVYCYENTFNTKNQIENYTTRIVVQVELNSGTSFYTIGNDSRTIYPSNAATGNKVEDQIIATLLENDTFLAEAQKHCTTVTTLDETSFTVTIAPVTDGSGNVTSSPEAGDVSFVIEYARGVSDQFVEIDSDGYDADAELETISNALNNSLTITYYEDGLCYYPVLIKHFGDTLTPWDSDFIYTATGETDSYADKVYGNSDTGENDWLGRYGVLRNNWYDIDITGIKELGKPTIPVPGTDQDDKLAAYICCKINVLSWAQRKQEVVL